MVVIACKTIILRLITLLTLSEPFYPGFDPNYLDSGGKKG